MLSPLNQRSSDSKVLNEDDVDIIKHYFRLIYGWISDEEYSKIELNQDFWNTWELINKEYKKKEELRLYTLHSCGMKHPK